MAAARAQMLLAELTDFVACHRADAQLTADATKPAANGCCRTCAPAASR
jgi:hypothetical protein